MGKDEIEGLKQQIKNTEKMSGPVGGPLKWFQSILGLDCLVGGDAKSCEVDSVDAKDDLDDLNDAKSDVSETNDERKEKQAIKNIDKESQAQTQRANEVNNEQS